MNEIFTSPRTGLQYALVRDGKALSVVGCTNRDIEHLKLPTRAMFRDGNIYPVVSISDEAFKGMEHLKYVDVPKSIGYIGEGAFRECLALERVWTKSSKRNLITLGGSAFRNCKKLEHVFGYFMFEPEDYTDSAFRGCESLYSVDYIKVYDGPEGYGCGIPDCIFKGCKSLNHVTIDGPVLPGKRRPKNPEYGWGEVGCSAFEGCVNLERIDGTFKMQTIDTDAFKGCDKLEATPNGVVMPTKGSVSVAPSISQTKYDVHCFDIPPRPQRELWLTDFEPFLWQSEDDPFNSFVLTHNARKCVDNLRREQGIEFPANVLETFSGGYSFLSPNRKEIRTPEIDIELLHDILHPSKVLSDIARMKYIGNLVSVAYAHKSTSFEKFVPKFIKRFNLNDYLKQINVILATSDDGGKYIADCIDVPLHIHNASHKPTIDEPTVSADLLDKIEDDMEKAIVENKELNDCETCAKWSYDVYGYYCPRFSHIVLYIDKIAKTKMPQLKFQQVLLHEYIHALLDWRTLLEMPDPYKGKGELGNSEETIDNMLLLHLYEHTNSDDVYKLVRYMIKFQPTYYSRAIDKYDSITDSEDKPELLYKRAIAQIMLNKDKLKEYDIIN